MKSKKNTSVLLILVIGIWALVAYQFFSFGNTENNEVQHKVVEPLQNLTMQEQPINLIKVDYRDPFLGGIYTQKNKKRVRKPQLKKTTNSWPQVGYKGFIASGKKTIYMIQVNNQNQMFTIGATIQELTLKKATKTSIIVRYKGEQKEIRLQQ